MARANETAGEAVSGIRTVKSFRTEKGEAGRYNVSLMDTHNLKTRRDTVRAIYLLIRRVSLLSAIKCLYFVKHHSNQTLCGLQMTELGMNVAMLYYGRLFIQYGQMSTGNLVSFILYQSDLGNNIRVLLFLSLIE